MDKVKVAEELTKLAKSLVYDADKYMEWAREDLEPMSLMVHSLKARFKGAKDTTFDKKIHSEIDKIAREAANFEKSYLKLKKALDGFKMS